MGLAKENCFSIRGGGERKREPILHTEKLPTSKREDRLFTRFALKCSALDAAQ
jgi:hypothetical protein